MFEINFEYILFCLFSSFSVISSIMVISLSNAVHSVLFLIFLFCNVSSLLLLVGAEFLSLMFLIIYVGAIAVLFLFVVMMLNVKLQSFNLWRSFTFLPIGVLISLIFIFQFLIIIDSNFVILDNICKSVIWTSWVKESFSYLNIEVLGLVLYTKYSFLFLMCSLILLVSMLGAITLTVHQRNSLKKQSVGLQLFRMSKQSVRFSSFY